VGSYDGGVDIRLDQDGQNAFSIPVAIYV